MAEKNILIAVQQLLESNTAWFLKKILHIA